MNTKKYNLPFIGGALFYQESVNLTGLYLKKDDWNEVQDEVITGNLLQARTISSAKRIWAFKILNWLWLQLDR